MALRWKLLKYGALAIGLFVLVSAVISVVATLLGIALSILTAVVSLLAFAAVTYALVKGILWLQGTSSETSRSDRVDTDPEDEVDRLTERYVDGDLSEAELERRLERELDGPQADGIDRELERLRSK